MRRARRHPRSPLAMRSAAPNDAVVFLRAFEDALCGRLPYGRGRTRAVAPEAVDGGLSRGRTPSPPTTACTARIVCSARTRNAERMEFYEELATIFAPLAPRSMIDIGCGTGHLLGLTVDRMAVAPDRVVGVDHSDAGIQRARELFPTARWIVADLYELSVEERFDLVICTGGHRAPS